MEFGMYVYRAYNEYYLFTFLKFINFLWLKTPQTGLCNFLLNGWYKSIVLLSTCLQPTPRSPTQTPKFNYIYKVFGDALANLVFSEESVYHSTFSKVPGFGVCVEWAQIWGMLRPNFHIVSKYYKNTTWFGFHDRFLASLCHWEILINDNF